MALSKIQTKIIATLGPATVRPQQLKKLVKSGVNVMRLNFAHANHEVHGRTLSLIKQFAQTNDNPVGVLLDLPGPKLRVGTIPSGSLDLKRDQHVILTAQRRRRLGAVIPISYPRLAKDLHAGHHVYIADGLIQLVVLSVKKEDVHCRVTHGGTVRSGNGVNMPFSSLSLKAFTKNDEKHLAFGLHHNVDFVGISFVATKKDVERVRAFCKRRRKNPFLIAKIERRQAINNLDAILDEADGIMVARGDLGVEVPFSEIPTLQKDIVSLAHRKGKPVILATQVLESMIQNPRPTRAEATDISNAILEGSDAIMLSAETSIGRFPIESVKALYQVIESTEKKMGHSGEVLAFEDEISIAVARDACRLAEKIRADLIVVPTRTGGTASRISRFRPSMPVLALVNSPDLRRRFSIYRGIQSYSIQRRPDYSLAHVFVRQVLLTKKLAKKGDRVLIVSGSPGLSAGETGMLLVLKV